MRVVVHHHAHAYSISFEAKATKWFYDVPGVIASAALAAATAFLVWKDGKEDEERVARAIFVCPAGSLVVVPLKSLHSQI